MSTKVICPICGSEIVIAEHEHTVENATVIGKDSNLGTVELPIAKRGKADDRLAALKSVGVDTSNLFAMQSASGEGMIVRIKDGKPEMVEDNDPIYDAIMVGGAIPERRLFRRWVMAQMFNMLTAKDWRTDKPICVNEAIRRHGYEYQWKMLVEEMRVQSILSRKDVENYILRSMWFTKKACVSLAESYMNELKKRVESLAERKCKGVPYKRIGGRSIFVSDIDNKVYNPLTSIISEIRSARDAKTLYEAIKSFDDKRVGLPFDTPFCTDWIDAYKGSGSFFTMKNLILFHGCKIRREFADGTDMFFTKEQSLRILEEKASEYANGNGWRMFAMMKKLIDDNHIDIDAKRREWREKKFR